KVKQDSTFSLPLGVLQSRCVHSVRASSLRERCLNRSTVSCTCASCLRVNRRPLNVVLGKLSTDFIATLLCQKRVARSSEKSLNPLSRKQTPEDQCITPSRT